MIRFSDYPEVFVTTSASTTSECLLPLMPSFCTKYEVLFDCDPAPYCSNVSVELSHYRPKSAVRVSSNSTFHSLRESIEDSISDHVTARDMLYHWEKQDNGRLASAYAVYFVEKNFSLMNLEVINSLLLSAAPGRLTPWSMVALLRASYSAKHLLPAWPVFYGSVKNELKDNERAPKLLAGLDQ
jgi:hypothetical protein